MNVLQLTTVVRDTRTGVMFVVPFTRSPVMVGRRDSNALRLDASDVSRHHGAFLFSEGAFHYVDIHSANGSYINGRRATPDVAVAIRDSSVVTIGPYQIVAHVDSVMLPILPANPDSVTPTGSFARRA